MVSEPTRLTYGELDLPGDGTVRVARLPVSLALAQEVLDYLFEKKRWHNDVEEMHFKVREWRQRIRAAASVAPVEVERPIALATEPAGGVPWGVRAAQLRRAGQSWRDVAKAVDRPVTTVRRVVRDYEAAGP